MVPPREGEAIDIVRYAEVMAHLRHFPAPKHAEVIARLGIRRRDWDVAADKWKRVRDAERMSGTLDVTVRFGRIFSDTRAKLDEQRPSLESLGPFPGPDGAPAEATPPAPVPPAPTATPDPAGEEPAIQVPSYIAVEQRAQVEAALSPLGPPPPVQRRQNATTAPMLGSSGRAAPVMPFAAPTGSTEAPFERAVAHAEAVQGPPSTRSPIGTGTVPTAEDVAGPPLPPGVPDLTLEQYASLRVDLEMAPDHAPATLARYGVPADGRAALDAHWKARFTADPPLRMMFAIRYAKYLAWVKSTYGEYMAWFKAQGGPPRS